MKADKAEVSRKIKIARGQLDGILRMIEEDRYCVDISYQLVATQSLLKRANQDILQAHIRHCVDISYQLVATQSLLKRANQDILQAHIRHCVREALQTDEPNPKIEEALKLLERMAQ